MVDFKFDRKNFTIKVIEQDSHILLDFDCSEYDANPHVTWSQKRLKKYISRSLNQLILDIEWSLENLKASMNSKAYAYGGGIRYKMEVERIFWHRKRIIYLLKAVQIKKKIQ